MSENCHFLDMKITVYCIGYSHFATCLIILFLLGVSVEEFTAVPMQGSGTFAIESVLQTAIPRQGGKVR